MSKNQIYLLIYQLWTFIFVSAIFFGIIATVYNNHITNSEECLFLNIQWTVVYKIMSLY